VPKTSEKPQPDGQGKPNKSRSDSQIEVTVNWHHTQEISPAFIRLMTILLRERIGNAEKTKRELSRPDNQVP
jgi:hypothetical protein